VSATTQAGDGAAPSDWKVDRLKPNALGVVGVLFMVIAFSAPITAMTGNVPVAVGYGNGTGAPAGFIVATVVLTVFAIGFVTLAKYVTSSAAFYGFISHGLGRPVGMAAGLLVMVGYMTIVAALIGIFSAFAKTTLDSQLGIDLPWQLYAVVMVIGLGTIAYFEITIAARVLIVMLVLEVSILFLMSFAVLFSGGGPDGVPLSPISPVNAFEANGLATAAIGLGLFMAFWSWIGFEATAVYGEESRNPRRVIPIATLIAVVGIGAMYTFFSWMAISGNGLEESIAVAGGDDPFGLFFNPTEEYLGTWGIDVFQWLLLTGSFACGLAAHNTASRYVYTLGREGIFHRKLGATHDSHQSPHMGSFTALFVAAMIVLGFALFDQDPYLSLFVLMAILATMSILIVQTICSFAVIGYFHVRKRHTEEESPIRTLVCPLLGGIAMIAVVYLLIDNLDAAAGAAAETLFFDLIPWIVIGVFLVGLLGALYLRSAKPDTYERIGMVVLGESPERHGEAVSVDEKPVATPTAVD
jgi:amino acid transporter